LKSQGFKFITAPFKWFLIELLQLISTKGDDHMSLFTPEQIKEMGEMWASDLFTPEERIAAISDLSLEERLAGANPAEVISYLKPKLKLSEILAGLSVSEIEELEKQLKQLKRQG